MIESSIIPLEQAFEHRMYLPAIKNALKKFYDALAVDPDYLPANLDLGELYFTIGDTKNSLRYFNSALKLDSNSSRAYNDLGANYAKSGDKNQALKYFEQAVALDPSNHFAKENVLKLKEILRKLKRSD